MTAELDLNLLAPASSPGDTSVRICYLRVVSAVTPLRVLVVEDDPQTRQILQKILTRDFGLRHLGLQVVLASDGAEGLQLFRERRPDLIITDLLMPRLDGFKLLEAIRSSPEGKGLPVLVLTAVLRDRKSQLHLERDYGAVLHNKPFSPKQLARQVLVLLRGKAADVCRPPVAAAASTPTSLPAGPVARSRGPAVLPPGIQGSLTDKPVARLLLEAHSSRWSGSLDLRRGKARKLVHFLDGRPIFVQSNLRAETLGQMLVRRGRLSPAQNSEALAFAEKEGIKVGESLVRLGLMSEAEVMEELTAQTRLKLESCLCWRSGSYVIREDPQVGDKVPRCPVDPVRLVFEGLRRHPDLEEAFARLAEGSQLRVSLSPALESYRHAFVAACGERVLEAIKRSPSVPTVAEVIQAAGSPHEAVLQIDILLQCGLATLSSSAGPQEAARPLILERAVPLEQLAGVAAPAPAAEGSTAGEDSAVIRLARPEAPSPPRAGVEAERARVALQLIQATYLGLHHATYYQMLGVTPQSDPINIEVAYAIKRRQFDPAAFSDIELGEEQERLEEIVAALDEAFAVLSDPARRADYDRSLQDNDQQRERNLSLQAEQLCRQAEELFERGHFAEAEATFAEAASLDDQPQYHSLRALAFFMARGQSPEAGAQALLAVQAALAADPGEACSYLVGARICRGLGRLHEARQSLQRLITVDPTCQEGFDELEDLLLEEGDVEALEKEYRRTLHLCGDQDPAWSALLWHRLALLYRDQLHDRERARLAAKAALRLKPKDSDLRALLAELDREHPDRWPETVLGYRSLLCSDAGQIDLLHQIFELHRAAGRWDAAYQAASVAVHLGAANDEERALVRLLPPAQWTPPPRSLPASALELLRHPEDDKGLASLFALLGPLLDARYPLRLEEFDLEPGELLARHTLPGPLRRASEQLAAALAVPVPQVALRPHLGADLQLLATDPPILVIGDSCLACDDLFELAFRLGRALAPLATGTRHVVARPRRVLRCYLSAAISVCVPHLEVADPAGEVAQAAGEIAAHPELRSALREHVLALCRRFQRLDLDEWQRGIQRTADRLGLLLCGDTGVAARLLAVLDPEAEVEICDFALSESYARLRDLLGLSLKGPAASPVSSPGAARA